jgi:hypothetical protein
MAYPHPIYVGLLHTLVGVFCLELVISHELTMQILLQVSLATCNSIRNNSHNCMLFDA